MIRIRRALVGLIIGLVVAWLAWPLVGLLSTWMRLPPDFEPLATLLLGVMIAMAAVAGWFYEPGEDPEDESDSVP